MKKTTALFSNMQKITGSGGWVRSYSCLASLVPSLHSPAFFFHYAKKKSAGEWRLGQSKKKLGSGDWDRAKKKLESGDWERG